MVLATFISHATHGEDQAWTPRNIFDLFAKAADMDIDRARLHDTLVAPDLIQQLGAGEEKASVSQEEFQKPEFRGG
jgi:hypothetical protein